MITLNIGSGRDSWGDVRVDLPRSQTGVLNKPNLVASALWLPIRSGSIGEIRCWHILEHVSDWRTLLNEIARVSLSGALVQLRFPLDDGYKRDFLISWSRLDISGMRHAYVTRKNKAHEWIVDPFLVSRTLDGLGMSASIRRNKRRLFSPAWILFPRWKRFLPRRPFSRCIIKMISILNQYAPLVDYEWVLDVRR